MDLGEKSGEMPVAERVNVLMVADVQKTVEEAIDPKEPPCATEGARDDSSEPEVKDRATPAPGVNSPGDAVQHFPAVDGGRDGPKSIGDEDRGFAMRTLYPLAKEHCGSSEETLSSQALLTTADDEDQGAAVRMSKALAQDDHVDRGKRPAQVPRCGTYVLTRMPMLAGRTLRTVLSATSSGGAARQSRACP